MTKICVSFWFTDDSGGDCNNTIASDLCVERLKHHFLKSSHLQSVSQSACAKQSPHPVCKQIVSFRGFLSCRRATSLWKPFGGMLDQGSDLSHLDSVAFETLSEVKVLEEAVEVVALEVGRELLEEGFDVGQVY